MIKRYYIDTSVIGGCFDDEFKKWSNVFFDEIKKGDKIAVISDLTFRELELAPDPVKNKLNEIPINFTENIITLDEAYELADQYVIEEAISRKFLEDAIHIANATLNMVHALVSWNFKHIVNLERIKRYNAVNLKNGYNILEIRSPIEVLNPDKNED
jgi:hypothetical protein